MTFSSNHSSRLHCVTGVFALQSTHVQPISDDQTIAPPLRANLTARPRLQARLDNGLQPGQRLMLIAAPAGFGKTTLIAEWLAALSARTAAPRAAWLSLDEGDNDPVRFIRYVIAALQLIDPALGEATLDLLTVAVDARHRVDRNRVDGFDQRPGRAG